MYKVIGVPTLDQATYRTCEKHGFPTFNPSTCRDSLSALLTIIEKARCSGNCSRLNVKGKLQRETLEYAELAHIFLTFAFVASITFGIRAFTEILVQLHNFRVLRFRRSSIGEPTFNINL
ncbi:hypothetical protein NPIL_494841 [Nephila pilipes]|uniref:Uncharacterized protein n=1 Tax=Nephila pilipes TaxID=299642 RepID=A0A8X6PFQ8_NEPPI|nr:hypothetical protein NPIL_494841 [Nephila pilipes]